MLKVLNPIGTPDSGRATVIWNNGDPRQIRINFAGTNSLVSLIDPQQYDVIPMTFGGQHPKQLVPEKADVIVNSLCDPDTNAVALHQLEKALERLAIPVINPPDLTFQTTREQTYARLHGTRGLIVPKTVRLAPRKLAEIPGLIAEHGLEYPYIFRSAGEHGGGGMVLVESEKQLPELERFAFDGRDFYAIAFRDFRDEDGLYRKYRLVVIDGRVYPRHLIVSKSWNIHSETREEMMNDSAARQQEEIAFLAAPPAQLEATCRRIHEKLPLDFFGIDCHLDAEGNMFIFELNTCMRIVGGNPIPYQEAALDAIKTAFNALIARKAAQA
ncbi:ATP-grasp domain-containing protein [Thiomicrolovo sp. ZZH C-3]